MYLFFRETITLTSHKRLPELNRCPDLPDDLWLKIFSYLIFEERMRIRRVCHRWNQLSRDSMFWRYVNFEEYISVLKQDRITDSLVPKIVTSSAAIQFVDLSGTHCQLITDQTLVHLSKHCLRLRKINLSNRVLIGNHGVKAIARACPLEQIILDNCFRVSDKGITEITKCLALTTLSITNCFKVSDKSLTKMAKNCSELQELNITGCTRITDKTINKLGKYSKSLKRISLKNTVDISIEAIEVLVQGIPNLRHIELGILQDEARTMAALGIIVRHCCSLAFLSFQHQHSQCITTGRDTKLVPKKRLQDFIKRLSITS